MESYYSAVDAAQITGITRRQLDYWVELGMIEPAITAPRGKAGSVKLFDFDGLFKLSILGVLIKSGFSIQALRRLTEDDYDDQEKAVPEKRPILQSSRSLVKLDLDSIIEKYKKNEFDNLKVLTEHGFLAFSLLSLEEELRENIATVANVKAFHSEVAKQKNKKH